MRNIMYVGSSSSRGLDSIDFDAIGVEHKDMVFPKHESVEVSNELADALLKSPLVHGEFAEVVIEEVVPDEPLVQFNAAGERVNASGDPLVEETEDDKANSTEMVEQDDSSIVNDQSIDTGSTVEQPEESADDTAKPKKASTSKAKS